MNRSDYSRYLASRDWAILKWKIKERSGGICERCHSSESSQVHHITYERIGRECLEDLADLREACHQFESARSNIDPILDTYVEWKELNRLIGQITNSELYEVAFFEKWVGDLIVRYQGRIPKLPDLILELDHFLDAVMDECAEERSQQSKEDLQHPDDYIQELTYILGLAGGLRSAMLDERDGRLWKSPYSNETFQIQARQCMEIFNRLFYEIMGTADAKAGDLGE